MSTSELVARLSRAVGAKNSATIGVISREISKIIPRMRPIDLVNIAKIAPSTPLFEQAVSESIKRDFRHFKSQDFVVLLGVVGDGKSINHQRMITSIIPNLEPLIPSMRAGDICYISWSLRAHSIASEFVEKLLLELTNREHRDFNELRFINITQLLSVCTDTKTWPKNLIDKLSNEMIQRPQEIRDKSFPFILYSFAEICSRTSFESTVMENFFSFANSQILSRVKMSPKDVIDSTRALGRIRKLEPHVFVQRTIPAVREIGEAALSPIQRKGILSAASSVGMSNSFSF